MSSKLFISAMRSIVACHFFNITSRLARIIIIILTLETALSTQRFFRIAVEWLNLHLYERYFTALGYLWQSVLRLITEL